MPSCRSGYARRPRTAFPRKETVIDTRNALVGGGASGIGYATAALLVRNGYRVMIAGRHADALNEAAASLTATTGQQVHTLVHDLSDVPAAGTAVAHVQEQLGSLDILVLNAGGPPPGRILDVQPQQWRDAFDQLLLGPLELAAMAMPAMAAQGFGRIVFVTSTAVRQPQPDLATSVVIRTAVTSAAKLLSLEHAAQGVTVNCVAPGPTATLRRTEILTHRAAAQGLEFHDADRADTATVPAGRAGRPSEIAAAIVFLVSESAGYVNGTVLTVDGGRTETIF